MMTMCEIYRVLVKLILHFLIFQYAGSVPVIQDDDDGASDMTVDLSYLGNKVFGQPSNATGKKLEEQWNENAEVNPEELGEYAEGDILFPQKTRNGLVGKAFRWKNGEIPFEIMGLYTPNDLQTIKSAMDIYHKYTCIRFRPRLPTDTDYISIVNGNTGCWSSVGRISGKQEINLQSPYCTTKVGTPMHELMHAVGFLHEQNRYERDSFVDIAWQNIQKGHDSNFDKADKDKTDGFGVPYDYRSVMHYSKTAFSVNGRPTIIPKDTVKSQKMGQRDGFSKGDITKINNMYNCPAKNDIFKKNDGDKKPTSNGSSSGGLFSFLFNLVNDNTV